jgi:hypothetical protein
LSSFAFAVRLSVTDGSSSRARLLITCATVFLLR